MRPKRLGRRLQNAAKSHVGLIRGSTHNLQSKGGLCGLTAAVGYRMGETAAGRQEAFYQGWS